MLRRVSLERPILLVVSLSPLEVESNVESYSLAGYRATGRLLKTDLHLRKSHLLRMSSVHVPPTMKAKWLERLRMSRKRELYGSMFSLKIIVDNLGTPQTPAGQTIQQKIQDAFTERFRGASDVGGAND